MTILQTIEKMEKTPKLADRNRLLAVEYHRNQKLRMLLDMIYGENLTKYLDKLPEFSIDEDVANGLHYNNLEKSAVTIGRCFYDPDFGSTRVRSLTRILENIAPQEVDVVKAIAQGKWKYCTTRFYSEELVKNTTPVRR